MSTRSAEQPFECAVRRHSSAATHLLRRNGVRSADLEDALQDVLLIFQQRFAEVPEPAQRSFLLGTARRVAADHRRLRWNRSIFQAVDPELADDQLPPLEALIDSHRGELRASEALEALPADELSVLRLARQENQSRTQIAATLGLPPGTVASRLKRANDGLTQAVERLRRSELLHRRTPLISQPWMAPGRGARGVLALPDAWAVHDLGSHRYFNNQWRRSRSQHEFEQCLLVRRHEGRLDIGWSWNWPGFDPVAFGYPEVIVGRQPWHTGPSTDARFPAAVAQTRQLTIRYEVESHGTGSYSLMPVISLTRAPCVGERPDPSLLVAEIIVLLDWSSDVAQAEPVIAQPKLGGAQYDLRQSWCWGSGQGSPFPAFVFKRSTRAPAGTLNVQALLDYLLAQRLLSAKTWISSVEFGNNVLGGRGGTWVKRFEVELSTAP